MQIKENPYFVLASEIGESGLKQKTGVDRYLKKCNWKRAAAARSFSASIFLPVSQEEKRGYL